MPIKTFLARRDARRGLFRRRGKTHIASRVVISKPVSWRKRILWVVLLTAAVGLAGIGLFIAGQYSGGYDSIGATVRVSRLEEENNRIQAKNSALTTILEATTTQLRIDQGARKSMESQIAKLEEERSRLNRDLALFDNLFPSSGADGQAAIRGFRIEPASAAGSPGAWRYRLLIMRPGLANDNFVGDIQLQVRYRQNGQDMAAQTPETGKVSEHLEFQRYQRVEGHFQAPAGAKLLGAVARVVENGKLVAESSYRP